MAIAFYCVYNERLKLLHYVGMVMTIVGVYTISQSVNNFKPADIKIQKAYIPIFLAFFTAITFTIRMVIMRWIYYQKFNPLQFTIEGLFVAYGILLMVAIYFINSGKIKQDLLWQGMLASFLNLAAIVCISIAVAKGYAAPAIGLLNV